MFLRSISSLTADQKHALEIQGIDRHLLSAWRREKRLPTEPQAAIYAAVARIDRHELQDEIALLRATPEQRRALERVLGKMTATLTGFALGVGLYTAGGFAQPAWSHGAKLLRLVDNVYRVIVGKLSFAHDRQYRFC